VIPATIMDREMLLGGDIILMVQGISVGTELENLERIVETIAALPNGDTVFVTVLRGGEQVVLSGPLRR
jgi:S1-C subfamily serine protease